MKLWDGVYSGLWEVWEGVVGCGYSLAQLKFSPSCLKYASPSVSQTGIGVYPWKLVCWREKGALPGADKLLAMHSGVQGDPSP